MGPGMMGGGMMGPMMQGQGGPGMMGQGWGPGQQGWGMGGPGMMGQGMMMGPGMQGWGMMGPGMMGGGMMAGNLDAYLASAKTQLGIDAGQEQTWNGYVKAVKDAADTMAGYRQTMMTSCAQGQMSMPDMQAQMASMMQARLAATKDIATAAKALYEKLNPQQRALADRILPPGMGMM
jgi:hypothetical protein